VGGTDERLAGLRHRELFDTWHPDDFHRPVGLSEAVPGDRLRALVAQGLLETNEYQEPEQRRRKEYQLTGSVTLLS
jgi:DNA-binding HxlR family transcriptional regulator